MNRGYRALSLGTAVAAGLSFTLAGAHLSVNAASSGKSHAAKTHAGKKAAANCKKITPKGTITFSDWEFPSSLNVYQDNEAIAVAVANGIFESLLQYNQKAKLVPDMAAAVPTQKNGGITNGGKTFTMHLKPGLKWSDGSALTTKDIKFGWQVGMDKVSGPYCTGTCDVISRIDTPNATTVVFHLKHPYAPFLAYGLPPIFPSKWGSDWNNDPAAAAKKIFQDTTFNYEGSNYPTNGAYQVSSFVNNDRILLTPMKYYRVMQCGASLQQLIFSFYSSKPGMIAAAASNQTDVTGFGGGYTAADLPDLRSHQSAYKLYESPGFDYEHLEFNLDPTYNGQPNPLHNVKVRQALALALDKYGLIQSALGLSRSAAKNLIAWTPWINTPTLVQPFADKAINGQWDPIAKKYVIPGTAKALADAKKLLDQTTYKNGFSLDAYTTSGNPVRQAEFGIIQSNWAKLGVKFTPNFIPASKLFASWDQGGTLQHGQFQVGQWGYIGSPDPDQDKYNFEYKYCDRAATVHTIVNQNESCINNATITKDMEAAARTLNNKQRAKYYYQVQVLLNQNAYWIPYYFRPAIATADSKVGNFQNNPTQEGVTWNMYAWKVKSTS